LKKKTGTVNLRIVTKKGGKVESFTLFFHTESAGRRSSRLRARRKKEGDFFLIRNKRTKSLPKRGVLFFPFLKGKKGRPGGTREKQKGRSLMGTEKGDGKVLSVGKRGGNLRGVLTPEK